MIKIIEPEKEYSVYTLNVSPGDTIIIQFDQDIFDVEECNKLFKVYKEAFPKNTVIGTFKGAEIKGVLKGDFYESKKYF